MIRESRTVLCVCVLSALGLHALGAWTMPPTKVEAEGGKGAPEAAGGARFADMVDAVTPPVPINAVVTPVQHDNPLPARAPSEAIRTASPAPVLPAVAPSITASVQPSNVARPAPPAAGPRPSQGQQVAARPNTPADTIKATNAPPPKTEAPKAEAPKSDAPKTETPKPRPPARTTPTPLGSNSAMAGAATPQGRNTPTALADQGTAAKNTYPGLVMRHLAQAPRPRITARGAALVHFTIIEGGGVALVRLLRSSGSHRLDRAALEMVRRAAPFPPPPHGAQNRFSVTVTGR